MPGPTVRVDAVCISAPDRRVAKVPQPEALVGPFGLAGDRHAGEWRMSKNKRRLVPNERQWSAVSTDEVEAFCREMGVPPFPPGALGENLRLSGIVLAGLLSGTVLEFPSRARLLIVEQNDPCENAARELGQAFGPMVQRYFVKASYGHRGVVGTVQASGIIHPGDVVRVTVPSAFNASISERP